MYRGEVFYLLDFSGGHDFLDLGSDVFPGQARIGGGDSLDDVGLVGAATLLAEEQNGLDN